MSLWLQAVLESLESGRYESLRKKIMPHAPIPIPSCMLRELEFAERHCLDVTKDPLFPIRFLWLMEGKEQRVLGILPGRSLYHPEKLLELWERASRDIQFRMENETAGMRFDFTEKAVKFDQGWIYIGDHFVDDFLEIEATLGCELLFCNSTESKGKPVFKKFK